MAEMGTDTADFLSYMAVDESANVNHGGNYSIEVIRKALEVMGVVALSINSEDAKTASADPLSEVAFICHLRNHWFSIRRLNGVFYNLNSLLDDGPERISDFYLRLVSFHYFSFILFLYMFLFYLFIL